MALCKNQFAVGNEIELAIDGLSSEGDGVGRCAGMVFFVPYTVPGEKVRARVSAAKKNFCRAALLEIIDPSCFRVKPPCPVFGTCGGCQLQHIAYREQCRYKEQRVRDALLRIGKIDETIVRPIRGMEEPWRYRNKVSFSVGEEKGKVCLGLFRRESRAVVPVTDCLLASNMANDIALEGFGIACSHALNNNGISILKHLIIRNGFSTSETMVIFVTQGKALPEGAAVAEELSVKFAEIAGVINVVQPDDDRKQPESEILFGKPVIRESLGKIQFSLSPDSFFQVNSTQAEVLYREAIALVQPASTERVFDAYCGVGGFALFFAPLVAEILGVERVKEAVCDAAENARLNGFTNIQFVAADLEKKGKFNFKDLKGFTTLVVDPPRRGLPQELIHQFASSSFEKILYTSCDPATLARDCRLFQERGFLLREVVPVDMFPQTAHLECLALLVHS